MLTLTGQAAADGVVNVDGWDGCDLQSSLFRNHALLLLSMKLVLKASPHRCQTFMAGVDVRGRSI